MGSGGLSADNEAQCLLGPWIDVTPRRHEHWGRPNMTPFQVFTGTFILILIFAALVAFLTYNAAHGAPLLNL
jgi:hypothetical protein